MSMSSIALRSVPKSSGDPFFASVNILLPMNGTNGGTSFPDIKGNTWTSGGGTPPVTSTAQSLFGSGSSGYLGDGTFSSAYLQTSSAGVTQLLAPNLINSTATFTIEMWVYATGETSGGAGAGSNPIGIGDYDATSGFALNWCFGMGNFERIQYRDAIGNNFFNGPGGDFSLNTWHFFTMVANSGAVTLYVDGVSKVTGTLAGTTAATTNAIQIGGRGGYSFPGYMYDVRVTNGIARYTSNFTPPIAPFPTS